MSKNLSARRRTTLLRVESLETRRMLSVDLSGGLAHAAEVSHSEAAEVGESDPSGDSKDSSTEDHGRTETESNDSSSTETHKTETESKDCSRVDSSSGDSSQTTTSVAAIQRAVLAAKPVAKPAALHVATKLAIPKAVVVKAAAPLAKVHKSVDTSHHDTSAETHTVERAAIASVARTHR